MDRSEVSKPEVALESERLFLRSWRMGDAGAHRKLWMERDLRVPAHRGIAPDGHPTVSDLKQWIRHNTAEPSPGLLVAQHKGSGAFRGYCGLVPE